MQKSRQTEQVAQIFSPFLVEKSEQLLKFSPLFSAKPDIASNAAALPNKNLQLRCRKSFGNLLTFFRKQCKIKELYITNPVADAVRKMASVFYWNCGVQLSEYRGSAQTSRRFFFYISGSCCSPSRICFLFMDKSASVSAILPALRLLATCKIGYGTGCVRIRYVRFFLHTAQRETDCKISDSIKGGRAKMEIVIVCLVACVICVAAVLVTNHTATQKGYTKGVQDGIQQRKQQAEAEMALPKKKRLVSFTMPRKKQNSKRKAYYWKPKMKSFSCVPMRKRKSKTAVLKSADRNEEYSRKKNLWTKNWKTSNAKRTIFPANKKRGRTACRSRSHQE